MVQPFFGASGDSDFGGYELGFGAFRWVYEKARVDELDDVLDTFFGADDGDGRLFKVD